MRASSTFSVTAFVPAPVEDPGIKTAVPVGVATMTKVIEGEVEGRTETVFTAAFDQVAEVGTYVAMESFDGAVQGRRGTFNFAHSGTTFGGNSRENELFVIVPGSGTGDLVGITGTGGIAVDDDGTHRIWFDYEIA